MDLIGQQDMGATPAVVTSQMLGHAMGVVAKTVDSQILSLPGSHERLMPAIYHALTHYEAAVAAIPGPLEISTEGHGRDPILGTLFPSANEIVKGLGCSLAVRNSLNWFVEHGHDSIHAVLGMRLRPNGNGGGNGALRFADHTFRSLGASDADARECLAEAAFTSLINAFATDYKDQQRKWRLAQSEQRLHQDPTAPAGDATAPTAGVLTPEAALELLIERLKAPEKQMRVEAGDGHPPVAPAGNGASDFKLPWLASTDRRTWLVCLTRFSLKDALAAIDQETLVHRYILI